MNIQTGPNQKDNVRQTLGWTDPVPHKYLKYASTNITFNLSKFKADGLFL